jgi:hypothetical protein
MTMLVHAGAQSRAVESVVAAELMIVRLALSAFQFRVGAAKAWVITHIKKAMLASTGRFDFTIDIPSM